MDTYRSVVAKAAISSGADLINDLSAGALDKNIIKAATSLAVLICLMHMSGNPSMKSLNSYPAGVISSVISELGNRVRAA